MAEAVSVMTTSNSSRNNAHTLSVLVSLETKDLVLNVLFCWINPFIALIGTTTNTINCVVFARQGLRDRMNLCLFSLALVDLSCVVFSLRLTAGQCMFNDNNDETSTWWNKTIRKNTFGFFKAFQLSSACITAIIAVERCVCVFLPMKAASLMKTRTMAVIILVTVGTLQVACLNYLFKMDIYLATDQQTNRSVYQTRLSETYMAVPEVFDFVENVLWAGLIPSCTVVVLVATVLTAVQLRRMAEWRKSSSTEASNKKQTALVKMLAVVSCIFIATSVPHLARGIVSVAVSEFTPFGLYRNSFHIYHFASRQLSVVNSSINFFVYFSRSAKFRAELLVMCRRVPRKKPEVSETNLTMSIRSH